MKNYFILLVMSVLFFSCQKESLSVSAAHHFYHLDIDGAQLPILVRGNTSSNRILIFVQGGPGYPSIDFALIDYPLWKESLEQDFAIVYYDQRGFGNKQGKGDIDKVTFDQYQKDLHGVIQLINSKYPQAKLYLFGYSFGASLSYNYLINYKSKTPVDAFISICGPWTHDGKNVETRRWQYRKDYLLRIADKMIANKIDTVKWKEAKTWALGLEAIQTPEQQLIWNRYVEPVAIETDGEITLKDYLKIGFASPYNLFTSFQYNLNDEVSSRVIEGEKQTNLEFTLKEITIPTLLLSAEYDDQAPMEEIKWIKDQLPPDAVEWHHFEKAGHTVYLDNPKEFYQTVKSFVNK